MTDTTGMSHRDATHASANDEPDGGHGHAHAGEPLGPVDVTAWGYALAGSLLGVLVVLALLVARGF